MKGLFKSNFLAVWTNAKIFLLFMFAMGIAVIIIPDQTWQDVEAVTGTDPDTVEEIQRHPSFAEPFSGLVFKIMTRCV